MQIKADLHVHTTYSNDSIITSKELVSYAKKRGLTAVAVTDHNQVESARIIAKETDFLIIPGTEVSALGGHIVGLNVQETIPIGSSVEDTVDRIHEAGGIAIACHPFALFKGSVGKHMTEKFDGIETKNSSSFPYERAVRKADSLAERFGLPKVGGTDAHIPQAIGYAYTLVEAEPNIESILKKIVDGHCEPYGGPLPFSLRIRNQMRFLKKYSART